MTIAWVDGAGKLLGLTADEDEIEGATKVEALPNHGTDTWDGLKWVPDTAEPEPTLDEKIDALLEAATPTKGSRLDQIKTRHMQAKAR